MSRRPETWGRYGLIAVAVLMLAAPVARARDAAFMDPSSGGAAEQPIKVEPKEDVDTGESVLNVVKRTALFFVNQTNQQIHVEKVTASGDGNVTAEITGDDCTKQKILQPLSRCSIEVSVTPTSPGPWNVDVIMTHDGPGRIVQARVEGKTSGATTSGDKKDTGLALSTKDINPVNFGDIEAGTGKAVRSALMVNDSADPITIYSIDVIEADNGLQRLDQGCAVDTELKPGESCPVTLVWTPTTAGQISTDLIIRHSGRLGFAVIPIRGTAKGVKEDKTASSSSSSKGSSVPTPPTPSDLEKASLEKIAPSSPSVSAAAVAPSGVMRLIGTVGNRAVILTPAGETVVANVNEAFDLDGKKAKIIMISAKSADVVVDGKKKTLILGPAPELTSRAAAQNKDNKDASNGSSGSDGKSSLDFGSAANATPGGALTATSLMPTGAASR